MLLHASNPPKSVTLDGQPVDNFDFSKTDGLLWIHFSNEAKPQSLTLHF
jgi:hypothetical protein